MTEQLTKVPPPNALDSFLCATRRWIFHTPLGLVWVGSAVWFFVEAVRSFTRTGEFGMSFVWFMCALFMWGTGTIGFRAEQRTMRQFVGCSESESPDGMARLLPLLAGPPMRATHPERLRLEAAIELARGNFGRAREIYASINVARIYQPTTRAELLSSLAVATALSGDPEASVPIGRAAVRLAEDLPARNKKGKTARAKLRRTVRANLGACLVLAGQNAEAVEILKPLVDGKVTPHVREARTFFYAKAVVGLGRTDEGLALLATVSGGVSSWATRARDEIEARRALPHRK